MTVRTWVYSRLTTPQALITLVGDRVFAKKAMISSIEDHPYIVYKMGYSTDENVSEAVEVGRQFIQVWVHDYSDGKVADYVRIDLVIKAVKEAFFLQSSSADGVIIANYLETSQDLNDETLNTVMKYVRFQLITKEI